MDNWCKCVKIGSNLRNCIMCRVTLRRDQRSSLPLWAIPDILEMGSHHFCFHFMPLGTFFPHIWGKPKRLASLRANPLCFAMSLTCFWIFDDEKFPRIFFLSGVWELWHLLWGFERHTLGPKWDPEAAPFPPWDQRTSMTLH